MSRPHDELQEALGAYVLGQLDDDGLRRDVDEHLGTCADCRAELADLGPLAAALRQVDPDRVLPVGITPPAELDERVRRALPGPGRPDRRWATVVAGALVGAAAATLVVVAVSRDDQAAGPTIIAVPDVRSGDGVTATAGLVDHTWGLEIKLEATGLADGETYEMWVVGDDGTAHGAGELVGVADTTVICDMSSSILLDDARSFKLVAADGTEVIVADLPG